MQNTSTKTTLRRYIQQPEEYAKRYGKKIVTGRDFELIETIYRYRHITTPQLMALFNPEGRAGLKRKIYERLAMLHHCGFVRRYAAPKMMRPELQESGGKVHAYGLDTAGWRELLARKPDHYDPRNEDAAPRWVKSYTRRQQHMLLHQVGVSNVRCAIECALRGRSDHELNEWDQGLGNRAEDRISGTVRHQGREIKISVAPDAYFSTVDTQGLAHRYLEVDRGTMTHERMRLKVRSYWYYLGSRAYLESAENAARVLVLFTLPSDRRLLNLVDTIRETAAELPKLGHAGKAMFWLTVADSIDVSRPESVMDPIWTSASNPEKSKSLFL